VVAWTVAGLATLLGAEAAVRLLGVRPAGSDRFRYHPTLGWTLDPERAARGDVDPDGFRIPAGAAPPGADLATVVVLGDSFAEGFAFDLPEVHAGLLESWLGRSATGPSRWRVLDLGVSGWGSTQELLAFRRHGLPHRPAAVVWLVFPHNDLCDNSIELARTASVQDHLRPYLDPGDDSGRVTWLSPSAHALRRSRLFLAVEALFVWGNGGFVGPAPGDEPEYFRSRGAYLRRNSRAAGLSTHAPVYSLAPDGHQPEAIRRAWDDSERIVRLAVAEIRGHGSSLIPVVVPIPRIFDPRWIEDAGRRARAPLDAAYATDRWEAIFRAHGVEPISLRRLIAGEPAARPDDFFFPYGRYWDLHFNRYGHFRVAKWILARLVAEGVVDADASPDVWLPPEFDLLGEGSGPFDLLGLSEIRRRESGPWRKAVGDASGFFFFAPAADRRLLEIGVTPIGGDVAVAVAHNGRRLAEFVAAGNRKKAVGVALPVVAGRNEVELAWGVGAARRPPVRLWRLRLAAAAPAVRRPPSARPGDPGGRPPPAPWWR
jgi:hypothetical protein